MWDKKNVNCPTCKSLLVFPRCGSCYCEDCGWPDEDFGGEFGYPSIGDKLEDYQPGLEFFDGEKWVVSGVLFGRHRSCFVGLYRFKLPGEI